MKKTLVALLAGLLMLAAGMLVSAAAGAVSPAIPEAYTNSTLFRPWSDPLMQLYWLVPFITAAILLRLWNFSKSLYRGDTFLRRGLSFAFHYWIITLPGMLISYSTFPLSVGMVLSWTLSGLAQAAVAGIVFARLQP